MSPKWNTIILVLGTVLYGCIEHVPKVKTVDHSKMSKEDSNFIKKKDYKGYKMYSGILPCEDCDRVEQRLVMKGDTLGVYRLTEIFVNASEDGDAVLVSTGEWTKNKITGDLHLSEHALHDSIRTMDYHVVGKEIVLFKSDNEQIKNPSKYHLKLIKSLN